MYYMINKKNDKLSLMIKEKENTLNNLILAIKTVVNVTYSSHTNYTRKIDCLLVLFNPLELQYFLFIQNPHSLLRTKGAITNFDILAFVNWAFYFFCFVPCQ